MSKGILILDKKPTQCKRCLFREDNFYEICAVDGYEPDEDPEGVIIYCKITDKKLNSEELDSIPDWCPIQEPRSKRKI